MLCVVEMLPNHSCGLTFEEICRDAVSSHLLSTCKCTFQCIIRNVGLDSLEVNGEILCIKHVHCIVCIDVIRIMCAYNRGVSSYILLCPCTFTSYMYARQMSVIIVATPLSYLCVFCVTRSKQQC